MSPVSSRQPRARPTGGPASDGCTTRFCTNRLRSAPFRRGIRILRPVEDDPAVSLIPFQDRPGSTTRIESFAYSFP
jgi:hypothetical protein